jgi:hypothetical protein
LEKPYPVPPLKTLLGIEALLIYAYQPAYNSQCLEKVSTYAAGMRIFNTGKVGYLLPEVSWLYFSNDSDLIKFQSKKTTDLNKKIMNANTPKIIKVRKRE